MIVKMYLSERKLSKTDSEPMKIYTNELEISPTLAYLAARALLDPIRKFYKNPINMEKYQKWLKNGGDGDGEMKPHNQQLKVETEQ